MPVQAACTTGPQETTVTVLVDRVWPRGIRKEEAELDEWLKDIAPSTDLRKWFDTIRTSGRNSATATSKSFPTRKARFRNSARWPRNAALRCSTVPGTASTITPLPSKTISNGAAGAENKHQVTRFRPQEHHIRAQATIGAGGGVSDRCRLFPPVGFLHAVTGPQPPSPCGTCAVSAGRRQCCW